MLFLTGFFRLAGTVRIEYLAAGAIFLNQAAVRNDLEVEEMQN